MVELGIMDADDKGKESEPDVEKHGTRIEEHTASIPASTSELVDDRFKRWMEALADAVDSPKAQLILRNAALMLLELPEHTLNAEKAYELMTDDQARANALRKLSEGTPRYWSEEWNILWRKDIDPLLSEAQQRVARRISLLEFWGREWDNIPAEVRKHISNTLKIIIGGK